MSASGSRAKEISLMVLIVLKATWQFAWLQLAVTQ
jgi:hypothetical protein